MATSPSLLDFLLLLLLLLLSIFLLPLIGMDADRCSECRFDDSLSLLLDGIPLLFTVVYEIRPTVSDNDSPLQTVSCEYVSKVDVS